MQIDSPYKDKSPNKVVDGKAYYYVSSHTEETIEYQPIDPRNPNLGVTPVTKTIEIPDNPEVVDLQTNQSNTKYWLPEKVIDPTGCIHTFLITNMGPRELECSKGCGFNTNFHVGINTTEENGKLFIKINNVRYIITT